MKASVVGPVPWETQAQAVLRDTVNVWRARPVLEVMGGDDTPHPADWGALPGGWTPRAVPVPGLNGRVMVHSWSATIRPALSGGSSHRAPNPARGLNHWQKER